MMIAKVAAGHFFTLALSLDGKTLYSCGQHYEGQCGLTDEQPDKESPMARVNRFTPIEFPDGNDLEFEEIACGEAHSLAIAKPLGGRREVYTWGSTVASMEGEACTLGHGLDKAPDFGSKNEYRPRRLVLKTKDRMTLVEPGVWRGVGGGAQHSTFLYTPAPKGKKSQAVKESDRNVLRKLGPS